MKTFAFAATALVLTAVNAKADSIGVAACDDFIKKYEVCSTKVPAAQQAAFTSQIDQLKKSWTDLAKNDSTKSALEPVCKQTADQLKAPLQAYGCSF